MHSLLCTRKNSRAWLIVQHIDQSDPLQGFHSWRQLERRDPFSNYSPRISEITSEVAVTFCVSPSSSKTMGEGRDGPEQMPCSDVEILPGQDSNVGATGGGDVGCEPDLDMGPLTQLISTSSTFHFFLPLFLLLQPRWSKNNWATK